MSDPFAALDRFRSRVSTAIDRSETVGRILRMTGWTMLAFALEKAAAIAVVFLLASVLGAQDYGRLTLAQGLVNTFQMAVVLGMGPVFTRYLPALRQESFGRAAQLIGLGLFIAAAGAALLLLVGASLARPLILDVLAVPSASPLAPWVLLWVTLTAGVSLATAILMAFERGRALGAASAIGAVLTVTLVPLMGRQFGLTGAVQGLVAIEAVKLCVLAGLYVRFAHAQGGPAIGKPRRDDLRRLWSFGLPVFLSGAVWAPTLWLAQVIVSDRAPDGLAQVGVFAFANSVLGGVILISSLTNRAALPVLSSLHAEGRVSEMRRVSIGLARTQLAAAGAIAAPLMLLAPWIMAQVGPAFAAQWPVLIIMIPTGLLLAAQTALSNYLLVTGRQVFLLQTLIPWSALLLGAAFIFSEFGAYSLSIGLLGASVCRFMIILSAFLAGAPRGPAA